MPKTIVITEGPADDVFMRQLKKANALNFEIRDATKPESYGNTGFELRLRGLKLEIDKTSAADYAAVVIVADNDEDPHASFASIKKQIEDAEGYNAPDAPYQLSARGGYPPIAVIMIPAPGQQGSLDTICLTALNPKYSTYLQCAETFAQCVAASEASFGVVQFAKLKVQCLLSSICKGDPYTPLKLAWAVEPNKSRPGDIFPLNHAAFNPIADFLRSVSP